ncbi:MAG: Membrane carboxypeptidase (penicillin-binding protein) [Burkholderiaceae bacterium]|nr:MAG: Membrane carboxypeptidase (penicillin-binding protein) [Burkholderiaceae bacterium]
MSRRGWVKYVVLLACIALAYVAYVLVSNEIRTSRWQAHYLARLDRQLRYMVRPGASDSIRFPTHGPYDERLGYAQLPEFTRRLEQRGYAIDAQARMSPKMRELVDDGLFTPYVEKMQAGLDLQDCNGNPLYVRRYPRRVYPDFAAVPPVLVRSLLFIENHDLLNPEYPQRNPAVDWRRFARANLDQVLHLVSRNRPTPGGSTLATQIEKYRHSPGGQTESPSEKLRQMASASVRAYLGGEDTLPWREHIVLEYVNTVPLSGNVDHGEVQGIGDGLWTWYGQDFDDANRLLRMAQDAAITEPQARVFKEALSLMIAQRRPSYYLLQNTAALDRLTDRYLHLLARAGAISSAQRDAALAVRLQQSRAAAPRATESFVERKAVNGVRTALASMLGVDTLYHLDRLDLSARSSIDHAAQQAITDALQKVLTPDGARAAGLYGKDMLQPGDDPGRLTFSMVLYEQRHGASLLRVQADSVDQPFDINNGARLNLGSTAKLRTVVTYLEIITALRDRMISLTPAELRRLPLSPQDAISRWAADYLSKNPGATLLAMLQAAMERKYSGDPGEAFATGGGLQSFSNFEPSENSQVFTVRVGFQHSVNLVFVRLMRDIVRYEVHQFEPSVDQWIADPKSPERRLYLDRFVDQESSTFMRRFYAQYLGKNLDQVLDAMFEHVQQTPRRLAVVLRSVAPDLDEAQFGELMRKRLKNVTLTDDDLHGYYTKYAIGNYSLNDRGYLARVHPLALWLANAMRRAPTATFAQLLEQGRDARREVYAWLYKPNRFAAQTDRIRHQLEIVAFQRIGEDWRRLGYPFDNLTPSLATAVGASGDRPQALARLMGLIVSDGVDEPMTSVRQLDFAAGTPYETRFVQRAGPPDRLLPSEITTVVRSSLEDVVSGGTARRLSGAFTEAVGGKTGTGDQRFGPRRVNRSATFVFFVGDRLFGTITAYVHEPYAARFSFTSAMAVQFLRSVAPLVHAMAPGGGEADTLACRG